LYKIEYVVNAPKERAVFNIDLYHSGGINHIYTSNVVVEKGKSASRLGYQALVKYSDYNYSKACLKFAEGINNYYVEGLPYYENNQICVPVNYYNELQEEQLLNEGYGNLGWGFGYYAYENGENAGGTSGGTGSSGGTTTPITETNW